MEKYIIYTDGGSRGNPGKAGVGVVILDQAGKILTETNKYLGITTNNEAEYQAVILGLETIKKIIGKGKLKNIIIELRVDSQLIARQIKGEYQIKEEKLFPLFIQVWNFKVSECPNIEVVEIKREENKRADFLANQAMDKG